VAAESTGDFGLVFGKTSSTEVRRRFKVKKLPTLLIITDNGNEVEEYNLKEFDAGT
jgi:hypothetical protein